MKRRSGYGWFELIVGILLVVFGVVTLFRPERTLTGIVILYGVIAVVTGISDIVFLVAFIAVNLAVMNLLPLPALDGGHILTLLLSWLIEKITGKKPDPRIEGYIHYVGLLLLLGLMVLLMYNDIVRIIRR